MDKKVVQRVLKLYDLWEAGKIERTHRHEVNPGLTKGSRENYLYFTLAPTLNFQRSSPALWKSALATWEDVETQYVFFPEHVVNTPIEKIRKDLTKHKLALQPNKHIDIWVKINSALHDLFWGDPRELLKEGGFDVVQILGLIQDTHKAEFPYLRGPKMSNYWLYILHQYTDVALTNLDTISIIPDTHVQQCSVQLGVVKEGATPEEVANAWRELLKETNLIPIDMHPVLWNWSRANFQPSV